MPALRARRRSRPQVLLVGGGTVGHLAPGFAVAAALRRRGVRVRFATPHGPGEEGWFSAEEPPRYRAPALRLPRRALDVAAFGPRWVGAVGRSLVLLRRISPRVVVGLGGWPCAPLAVAAWLARLPLALIASDRQPGRAVRVLAPLAGRVYVAHRAAAAALTRSVGVVVTGPVLREEIGHGVRDPARFGLEPGRTTLLVTGGSLGARALNEAVARGVEAAVRARPARAASVQVLHAVGQSGAGVADAYRRAGVAHTVVPFVRRMGDAYATADLVVARAGALTCAELEAVGVPAVLVPYPHHADRQQFENAAPLVERGGALLVEESALTPEAVEAVLFGLLEDAEARARMARALRLESAAGVGQIADDLVRLLEEGAWRAPRVEAPPA